jgi:hypothetical protein
VILLNQALTGGTKLTRDLCIREKKPFIVLDAMQISVERAVGAVIRFVDENEIQILNVAGPRMSGWPQGYAFALAVVGGVIGRSTESSRSIASPTARVGKDQSLDSRSRRTNSKAGTADRRAGRS